MGYRFEVHAWVPDVEPGGHCEGFRYELVYTGQSLIDAVRFAWRAKKTSGCVKIEWR